MIRISKSLPGLKRFYHMHLSMLAFGERDVECNICGWRGKHFHDIDCGYGVVWKNMTYPSCDSQPRHRTFTIFFNKVIPPGKQLRLLHFAPEACMAKKIRGYKNIDYLSADLCTKRAMREEDITHLSFGNESFDIILCSHVLEHVENDEKAISELYRILGKGGFAIIDVLVDYRMENTYEDQSITSPDKRAKAFGQWDHVRIYGRDFAERLRRAGFRVHEDDFVYRMEDEEIRRFGLRRAPIYVCRKGAA